ncbi:hypothetical protein T10_6896 [Trichinella papuae]|uniref:Uncharacterized protein n=2 Tax=Trichinella TaxID=6333 RepID=A0A0V1MYG9_9BILA|nr:hypothetical protein T10_6896 [Trichinella papuae]
MTTLDAIYSSTEGGENLKNKDFTKNAKTAKTIAHEISNLLKISFGTLHDCVFVEILPKTLKLDTNLVGTTESEIKLER